MKNCAPKSILLIANICLALCISAQNTYNDIAPVLYKNCAYCHRPGGGGPFSMLTYNEIFPWKDAMKMAIEEGDMPPWAADSSYLHFANERLLTAADKAAIINWIDAGAPEGNPAELPAHPNYPEFLLNGTPDLVLTLPAYASNAGSEDTYNTVVVASGLTQARFVRAIEMVADNPELIHHALINADTAGEYATDLTGMTFDINGDIAIGEYLPGSNPIVFPNTSVLKTGIWIPANADIIVQIHTPKNTLGQMVGGQIRLYLYPENETNIRPMYSNVPLQHWGNDFWIAANTTKTMTKEAPGYNFPISIYSAVPHSHQICTEITNYAFNSALADTIKLMKILNWDFEHQEYYYYKNLIKMPAGYKWHAHHKYDNTSNNPHNPFNPPQLITVGPATTDEMLFDGFQFMLYQNGDENINLDSLFNNEPLFQYSGINNNLQIQLKPSFVQPNPVNDRASIFFVHPHQNWKHFQLRIFTMEGKQVTIPHQMENGRFMLNTNPLKKGIYLYEIWDKEHKISAGNLVKP